MQSATLIKEYKSLLIRRAIVDYFSYGDYLIKANISEKDINEIEEQVQEIFEERAKEAGIDRTKMKKWTLPKKYKKKIEGAIKKRTSDPHFKPDEIKDKD